MLRVIYSWNSRPDYVLEAPSVKLFERRLDFKFWGDQPIRFDL